MADIGRRSGVGAAQSPVSAPETQNTLCRSYRWTATANQEVFRFGFLKGSVGSTGQISFVLLDVTGLPLDNPDGAPIVAGPAVIASPFTTDAENTVDITPVALTEGREYAVAYKVDSGTVWMMRENPGVQGEVFQSDLASNVAWPTSPAEFSYPSADTIGTWEYVAFAVTQTGASGTLDSVDSPIEYGDTINFSTTGFGTITSRTVSDGANTISLGGGDTTANMPALGDEINQVLSGSITFEVSDGTFTENQGITLDLPSGYNSILLSAGFDTGPNSFLYNYGGTPAVGDEFIFLSAEVELNNDGSWEMPTPGQTTIYAIDATDGYMESFSLETAYSFSGVNSTATPTSPAAAAVAVGVFTGGISLLTPVSPVGAVSLALLVAENSLATPTSTVGALLAAYVLVGETSLVTPVSTTGALNQETMPDINASLLTIELIG